MQFMIWKKCNTMKKKVRCLCCGYRALDERGGFDICPVCFWEDDCYLIFDKKDENGNSLLFPDHTGHSVTNQFCGDINQFIQWEFFAIFDLLAVYEGRSGTIKCKDDIFCIFFHTKCTMVCLHSVVHDFLIDLIPYGLITCAAEKAFM